jgi:hypothetical protein
MARERAFLDYNQRFQIRLLRFAHYCSPRKMKKAPFVIAKPHRRGIEGSRARRARNGGQARDPRPPQEEFGYRVEKISYDAAALSSRSRIIDLPP